MRPRIRYYVALSFKLLATALNHDHDAQSDHEVEVIRN